MDLELYCYVVVFLSFRSHVSAQMVEFGLSIGWITFSKSLEIRERSEMGLFLPFNGFKIVMILPVYHKVGISNVLSGMLRTLVR